MPDARPLQCAIYTRKSTEEGLDRDFNSLEAQREAAEDFIHSQKHLGWQVSAAQYKDGGCSGGTLERPALQRLLADIEAGQIDCVVVYKVDRLSRSLLDFARLMDRFEQRSVSFVSVTQQFNTTTSLGRLTLNILLSFAQFEREIISERTRDKMSAARRKGKWVGGRPVLGYDVDPKGGRLIVNQKEAGQVRQIFELYRRRGSLASVLTELTRRGWTTKSWVSNRGIQHGGRPFSKASLKMLLSNAVYAGKVKYRGVFYPGEQPALVDPLLWQAVNSNLDLGESAGITKPIRTPQQALLAGILFCAACDRPMLATYTSRGKHKYRYYVCRHPIHSAEQACRTSVSAQRIEERVLTELRTRLGADEKTKKTVMSLGLDCERDPRSLVQSAVEKIRYEQSTGLVSIQLQRAADSSDNLPAPMLEFKLPTATGRHRAVFGPTVIRTADGAPRMARLVALAHRLEGLVRSGRVKDYAELAQLARVSPARITQIIVLSQLAPEIQEYVLFLSQEQAGRLSEQQLRRIAREPRWDRQRAAFQRLLASSDGIAIPSPAVHRNGKSTCF